MFSKTFLNVVTHRGRDYVVKGWRDKPTHRVEVFSRGVRRLFHIGGKFEMTTLRNAAAERFNGLEGS